MKKLALAIMSILMSMFILTSCGTRPVDKTNHNFVSPAGEQKIEGCDIYYNVGTNMTDYINIDSKKYNDIIYAAAGVARSTWYDGNNKLYTVTDEAKETDFNFLNNSITDQTQYTTGCYNILNASLEKISPERVSIIVTDLQTDLNDYAKVSESIVNNVLKKNLSIGFIGVQLDIDTDNARTFFILVIADEQNLSKYISNFKQNPSIVAYSGETHDFQMDTVNMINYQIIANKSGIKNIKYDQIEYIENGFYAGSDGNIDVQETTGSFSKLRKDYSEKMMNSECEGTVNYSPNVQRLVNIDETKENRKSHIKSTYIGAKSLVYEKKNSDGTPIAGKLKLNVPFDIIDGVKLSKIQCDIETKIYVTKSGTFKPCDSSDIIVTLADGVTPEQGKWRVDNKNNSVVLNILTPNAGKLPIDNGVVKLDITFKQNDTIESVSNWVKNWNNRGCNNILNLFDSIYTYQKDANVSENTLTVYLATGDQKFTKRADRGSNEQSVSGDKKIKKNGENKNEQ